MKYIKIKKCLLSVAIEFATLLGAFKLSQEIVDFLNQKQISQYEDIVDDFVDLMKKEGIEDPIEIFDYYNYALWNGYLSNDHKYQYDVEREIFISNSGLSCITGSGVCLNKADFLSSIFKEYGCDAYTVNCYMNLEDILIKPIRTNFTIDENISKVFFDRNKLWEILNPIIELVGNHCITCVEYDGKFYYFDPTNLVYLEKVDFNTLEIINGSGSYDIKYFASMLYGDLKSLQIINDNGFDYSEFLNSVNVYIDLNQLQQFYDNESDNYKLISDQLRYKNQFILSAVSILIVWLSMKKAISEFQTIKGNAQNLIEEKVKIKKMIVPELK